ncbi:hypothetical protein GCM10027030_02400 [Luteococcus sediminum]
MTARPYPRMIWSWSNRPNFKERSAACCPLWGSIHPDNQPSNALSLGREVVGAYIWLTPTGLRGL